jgi:hypothetical protein
MNGMQPSTTSAPSSNLNHFVDPNTGDRLEGDALFDCEGCAIVGSDDEGTWWGTERAAWVLSEQYYSVIVNGYLGADPYVGYFIGTSEEARFYAMTHGVKDIEVMSGA